TPGASAAATTGAPAPTASAKTHQINCDVIKGRRLSQVKKQLEDNGYTVKQVPVTGAIPGVIKDVSPCGRQPEGTVITLSVVPNADGTVPGGGLPSTFPSENGGGN